MVKLECPYCGRPAVSMMRKLILGPITSATCKTCGERISVSYLSILFLVPFYAAIVWWALRVEPF
jgi:transcription elongation factor Elf1